MNTQVASFILNKFLVKLYLIFYLIIHIFIQVSFKGKLRVFSINLFLLICLSFIFQNSEKNSETYILNLWYINVATHQIKILMTKLVT